jgi:hypothetical protein
MSWQRDDGLPIERFDWVLLVDHLATLPEDEMTTRCLPARARAKCFDQDTFRIGQESIWKVFLCVNSSRQHFSITREKGSDLGLPLCLGGRRVGAQAVHVKVRRGHIGVDIPETARLIRASRYHRNGNMRTLL